MKKKPWKLNMTCLSWDIGIPPRTDAYDGELKYDYDSQKLFINDKSSWVELVEIPNDDITRRQRRYPTICPNCGAPHNPNIDYCEYCGTFF